MLRESRHGVDSSVHQFHVLAVAARGGDFRRRGVGDDVPCQARHRRAVQHTLPTKPSAESVLAVVVVGPVAQLESLGLGSGHVVEVELTGHGPCADEAGHGVLQGVHLHLGGVNVAVVLGQQVRARLRLKPFGGVLLRLKVDVHIEGNRRVFRVQHCTFQVGRPGAVIAGQNQGVGGIFQEVVRRCAGLDTQPVNAQHSIRTRAVRRGQGVRRGSQLGERVDAAVHVGLVTDVERFSLGIAGERQIFRAFHGLVGQPIQEIGGTKRVHVVVDAEAACGVHVDLFRVPEDVHFDLEGVASSVVKMKQRCARTEVLGPFTHDDFGAIHHSVHVSASRQHDLEIVGQTWCEHVFPAGGGDADGEVVEIRPAEIPCARAVADPALVQFPDAFVDVVADAVLVLVGKAGAATHAQGVFEDAASVVGVGFRVVVARRRGIAARDCRDAGSVVVEHLGRVVSDVVDGVRVRASAAFTVARAKRERHADFAVGISVFENLNGQLA